MGSASLKTISRWSEAIRNWLRLPQVFPNHTFSHNFSVPGHARLAFFSEFLKVPGSSEHGRYSVMGIQPTTTFFRVYERLTNDQQHRKLKKTLYHWGLPAFLVLV